MQALIHPLRKAIHIYTTRKQTTLGFILVIRMRDVITSYTLLLPVVLPPRLQRSTARVLLDAHRRPQPTEGVQPRLVSTSIKADSATSVVGFDQQVGLSDDSIDLATLWKHLCTGSRNAIITLSTHRHQSAAQWTGVLTLTHVLFPACKYMELSRLWDRMRFFNTGC